MIGKEKESYWDWKWLYFYIRYLSYTCTLRESVQ